LNCKLKKYYLSILKPHSYSYSAEHDENDVENQKPSIVFFMFIENRKTMYNARKHPWKQKPLWNLRLNLGGSLTFYFASYTNS